MHSRLRADRIIFDTLISLSRVPTNAIFFRRRRQSTQRSRSVARRGVATFTSNTRASRHDNGRSVDARRHSYRPRLITAVATYSPNTSLTTLNLTLTLDVPLNPTPDPNGDYDTVTLNLIQSVTVTIILIIMTLTLAQTITIINNAVSWRPI